MTTDAATRIAEKYAYSADRYANWTAVARKLLAAGLTEDEAYAVMASKWARWAADHSGQRYGKVTAKVLVDYTLKQGMAEVRKLAAETAES